MTILLPIYSTKKNLKFLIENMEFGNFVDFLSGANLAGYVPPDSGFFDVVANFASNLDYGTLEPILVPSEDPPKMTIHFWRNSVNF